MPVSELEEGGVQEMKSGEKLTMTREFVSFTRSRMESGTLRGCGQSAKAELWLKMTGAALPSHFWGVPPRMSRMVAALTCEMSTSMPSLFISLTASWPRGLTPLWSGGAANRPPVMGLVMRAASAKGLWQLWVRVA